MAVEESNPKNGHWLLMFFVLAYALSWAVEIPLALRAHGLMAAPIPWSLHYLSAVACKSGIGAAAVSTLVMVWAVVVVVWFKPAALARAGKPLSRGVGV